MPACFTCDGIGSCIVRPQAKAVIRCTLRQRNARECRADNAYAGPCSLVSVHFHALHTKAVLTDRTKSCPRLICTTRIVAGVGIPQLTALYVCSRAAQKRGVTLLADGGITKSGDIVKALTLAEAVVCGGMLAGCHEAPGEVVEIGGKLYKQYRGMGSMGAMKAGSATRYGHEKADPTRKVAPEGIEALKESCGSVERVLALLIGGMQSGLGYLGAANLAQLRARARYCRVSPAGMKEAAPHDVVEVKTTNRE